MGGQPQLGGQTALREKLLVQIDGQQWVSKGGYNHLETP